MTEAQKHNYATAPHGSFDMPQELQPNADLHARLTRASIGASDEEAAALIESLPSSVIKSESDLLLRARVKDFRKEGSVFVASEHSIAEVESHVGDDVDKARDALASETGEDGKHRKTLVAKLEALVGTDQANTPSVVATPSGDAGVAADGSSVV